MCSFFTDHRITVKNHCVVFLRYLVRFAATFSASYKSAESSSAAATATEAKNSSRSFHR